jgi:hypothetical protein
MTRLTLLCAGSVIGTMLLVSTGCDSITAVAKDQKNQVEKYLKDKTVLQRANVQLEEAKNSRKKLEEIANKFNIDAEIALRQIKRVNEEKDKTRNAFETLQGVAKNAGLPKFVEATPEDKAKQISVGAKTYTGEDVYRVLKEYKASITKADTAVAREQKKSDFLKDRSEKIRNQMSRVDNNISEMEQKIEDYKMYQEMLAANKTIDDLGLSDDKMKQILATDSIVSELQKQIDSSDIAVEIKDKESSSADLKDELNSGGPASITDDDLI